MNSDFAGLLLHEKTRDQLENFLNRPSHAALIVGAAGSGKTSFGRALAASLLAVDELDKYPYYTELRKPDDKQEIPIEDVRRVISSMNLKIPTAQPKDISRVVFIDEAQRLGPEAQNALLKTLEEPAPRTTLLLSAESTGDILPTVASRAQKIQIFPVTLGAALSRYSPDFSQAEVEAAWRLSAGSAGLLQAILESSDSHPLKSSVDDAKRLLQASPYQRLIILDRLAASRAELTSFLDGLGRVIAALHQAAIKKDSAAQAKKMLANRQLVNSAVESLAANSSPRLVCLNLALRLST